MNKSKKKHIRYINGLKGFACLLIMLGHFAGLYKYAEDASRISSPVLQFIPDFFTILLAEKFWLRLFFVISGFLVAESKVDGAGTFISKVVTRLLRLGIPILGASLMILLIDKLFGMQNRTIQVIVRNSWITKFYDIPLTFIGALEEPIRVLIFGRCRFNTVFWVLKDMFWASILVYFISFVKTAVKKKTAVKGLLIIILIVAFYVTKRDIYGSVLIGAILGYHNNFIVATLKRCNFLSWGSFLLPVFSYILGTYWAFEQAFIIDISFAFFIAAIETLKVPNDLFSKLDKLGDYSFGIYALHWPIFCSIGFLFLERMIGAGDGFGIYCLTILLCCVITLFLAVVFAMTVEKWSAKLCARTGRFLIYRFTQV